LLKRLVAAGRTTEAVELMRAAHAYNPRSFANNQRLVEYYGAHGDEAKAASYRADLAASGPR
jgi:two-component SAPR family response regulator